MWVWIPMRSIEGASWQRRIASSAAPEASESPNFWSSCAVAMYSWPPAWTPVVTRTATGATMPSARRDSGDDADLGERVDDDPADADRERPVDLLVGLVVAVHRDPGAAACPRVARARARRRTTTSMREAVVAHPSRHLRAQERLARVVDGARRAVLGERRGELVAERRGAAAHVVLVHHIEGRAVLGREGVDVASPDPELAVGARARPCATTGPRTPRLRLAAHRYILSGAPTPSNPRPLARTWRVASLSHRRVRWRSVTGSSPRGVTRVRSYQPWKAAASSSR